MLKYIKDLNVPFSYLINQLLLYYFIPILFGFILIPQSPSSVSNQVMQNLLALHVNCLYILLSFLLSA